MLTYLHTDHLGTPRYGTNTGGTQVWTWASNAYGGGAPSGSATINLRFPGQYYDAETGLHYNWNRYYSQATGRYVSVDPIGLDGGMNTFNYADVSPIMYIDPEGLMRDCYPNGPGTEPVPCSKYYGTEGAQCPSGACADGRSPAQHDKTDIMPPNYTPLTKCQKQCLPFSLTCGVSGFFVDAACSTVLYKGCIEACEKLTEISCQRED